MMHPRPASIIRIVSGTACLLLLGAFWSPAAAQDAPRSLEELPTGAIPDAPQGVLEPQEGSVMFSDDESARLKKALEIYDSKVSRSRDRIAVKDEDDFLAQLLDVSGSKRQHAVFPYFFLSSIVYVSPKEWTVFINDHKIVPRDLEKTRLLSVEAISKSSVRFKWRPFTMPEISHAWKHRQSLPGPFSPVAVDEDANAVSFTLKPNQTFFSRYMEVVEGKLPPHLPPPPPLSAEATESSILEETENGSTFIEMDVPPKEAAPAPEPVKKAAPEPTTQTMEPEEVEEVPSLSPPTIPVPEKEAPAPVAPGKSKLKSLFEDLPTP